MSNRRITLRDRIVGKAIAKRAAAWIDKSGCMTVILAINLVVLTIASLYTWLN